MSAHTGIIMVSEKIAMISGELSKNYPGGGVVDLYTQIALIINSVDGGKFWTWKYVRSVELGHIPAGKRFDDAIDIVYRMVMNMPLTTTVECCVTCGSAPTVCLCDGRRVVTPKPKCAPRNRRAINLDSAESAAATIRSAATPEYIDSLAQLLGERNE